MIILIKTSIGTVIIKLEHISYNTGTRALPDIYAHDVKIHTIIQAYNSLYIYPYNEMIMSWSSSLSLK